MVPRWDISFSNGHSDTQWDMQAGVSGRRQADLMREVKVGNIDLEVIRI